MLLLIVIIIFMTICQCKTGSVSYYNTNIFKGRSGKDIKGSDSIDKSKTYKLYFILNEKEECIKINMVSTIYDEISGLEKLSKIFFIVEKAVDISQFKKSKNEKIIFSELGRNFDYSWNREREIIICSSDVDPIKKLSKNIYRVRFTIFRNKRFNYEINIFSNNKIKFDKQLPSRQ